MATISDIKSYQIVGENIIGTIDNPQVTITTESFHEVEVVEVVAPLPIAIVDIGVVGLGNTGTGSIGAVDSVNGQTGNVTLDQDDIPDGTTHKQYTATEKTKLAGIASGATVNDTDANLKNRANHTGSQAISTVTGLQTAIDNTVAVATFNAHATDTANPHAVTKAQVGLGSADNTSDLSKPISTATQTALNGKAATSHTHIKSEVGLTNVDNTSDDNKPVSTATQTALDGKSNVGHTHAKTDVGLANVDNTSDLSKPVSTATQTALDGKQPLDSDLTAIAALTATNDDLIQRKAGAWINRTIAQVKADLALTKTDVGLANVDNTSDANKPVSSATQTALNLKAPLASPTFTGTVAGITKAMVGLTNVDNTADSAKPISSATQSALDAKAPLASPAFTGTPTGITKTHVGLGSVDNTADTAKPISTTQQTAFDARFVWADGTTSTNARPSTSSKVLWVGGTTQPVNMATGDLWVKP